MENKNSITKTNNDISKVGQISNFKDQIIKNTKNLQKSIDDLQISNLTENECLDALIEWANDYDIGWVQNELFSSAYKCGFPRNKSYLKDIKKLILYFQYPVEKHSAAPFPKEFAILQQLEHLEIYDNDFDLLNDEFPMVICRLVNIKSLCCSNCRLTYLPNEFANLKKLDQLWLSHNKFDDFSQIVSVLYELPSLRELYLRNCRLEYLPDNFANLQKLKCLSLRENKFKEFPQILFKLPRLRRLYISDKLLNKDIKAEFVKRNIIVNPQEND